MQLSLSRRTIYKNFAALPRSPDVFDDFSTGAGCFFKMSNT